MPQNTADALARAYEFLRHVEHRIQYLDDQQTHLLPTADADLAWIARSLGLANCTPGTAGQPPSCALIDRLLVYPARMLRNLELTGGLVFSGQLLLELAGAGMSREDATSMCVSIKESGGACFVAAN